MRPIRTSRLLAASAALVLAASLASCGSDTEPTASDPEPTASPTPTEEPSPTDAPSKQPQADDADLPGDPMDGMPPVEGDELDVVGVEVGDVLNVRALPDPGADAVGAGLDPLAEGLRATGRNRLVDSGIWAEIETEAGFGWANTTYLAYLGAGEDRTGDASGVAPSASTKDLAEAVASELGLDDVVVVFEDSSRIVVDSIGAEDDSNRGGRLVIALKAEGDEYAVDTVTASPICARGLSGDGLCL